MTDDAPEEQCVVHITDYDPDCEMCKSEVAEIQHAVKNNAIANTQIEQRLRNQGRPVSMTNVIAIRLDTLIAMACGGNPKTAAKFELTFMANYASALQQAERQPAPSRLIVPGT